MPAAFSLNDTTTRLMVSDAVEEAGSLDLANLLRSPHWPLTPEQAAQLEADLARANGRRRTRTLDLADCVSCARNALADADGTFWVHGGTVANAYKYPSSQTVCVAVVRSNGTVRVGVAVTSGSKGSSPTTPVTGLPKNARPEDFRTWADRA